MTKHAFLEGMGLGVLAGAAIGMAVAARGVQETRRVGRPAVTSKWEKSSNSSGYAGRK